MGGCGEAVGEGVERDESGERGGGEGVNCEESGEWREWSETSEARG